MKPTQALIGLFAAALILSPLASAKNAYRLVMIDQYKLADKTGKTDVGCAYCHTNPSGGEGWNSFGMSFKGLLMANRNVSEALYLTLKANKDADGDGYSDALEVFAKTLPGDAASKPSKTKAVLEKEFAKAGGVAIYQKK